MATLERLTEHYDAKYESADCNRVVPVPIVKRPKDRRQMLVYLAARPYRKDCSVTTRRPRLICTMKDISTTLGFDLLAGSLGSGLGLHE